MSSPDPHDPRTPVYEERNRLVALVAAIYPSSLERDLDEEEEDDWRWVVFVELPAGQVTWHIHDSQLPLFEHVPKLIGRVWDNHDTRTKYRRVEATIAGIPRDYRAGKVPACRCDGAHLIDCRYYRG